MNPGDIQAVKEMPVFAGLGDNEMDFIAMGEIVEYQAGTILVKEGDPARFFYVTLAGEVRVWRHYDRQDVLISTSTPGMFLGEISILTDVPATATVRVSQPARLFRLDKEGFWKMMSTCPSIARDILRAVAERFRNLEGIAHHREKLISLGTMAAGLAHEINNPASAAVRAASELQRTADNAQWFLSKLVRSLNPSAWKDLLAASEDARDRLKEPQRLDSMVRSDKENALNEWMEKNNISDGWLISGTFVEAGLDILWLQNLINALPAASHADALQWLADRMNRKLLLKQVVNSTGRVSELVKAVKSYTQLDCPAMRELDVHEGLESTLIMLSHKLKNVTLCRVFDQNLPRIVGCARELNQVWTNMIDNAIDAVDGKGRICIGTYLDGDHVVVEIVDNGAGIPPEVQAHIFEPFFTTKAVGSGTGLGLVICHRIVNDRHGGNVEFKSKPGETRFLVRLPLGFPGEAAAGTTH